MKYIKLTLFLTLSILFSCQNGKTNKLKSNQVFTESETVELISLLDKFDKEICRMESKSKDNFLDCYNSFFERILKEAETGNIKIGITRKNQQEIIESLNPNLRNEFWGYGKGVMNRRIPNKNSNEAFPDTIKSIYLTKGKYFKYLEKEISQISPKTKLYFERLSKVMDISSPSIVADIIKNYDEYEIADDRIRFLIAIHYLTMNYENLERIASYDRLEEDIKSKFQKKRKK